MSALEESQRESWRATFLKEKVVCRHNHESDKKKEENRVIED